MNQAAYILLLQQILSLLSEEIFDGLLNERRLLEILESTNCALQHHQAQLKYIKGTIFFLSFMINILLHEIFLSGIHVEYAELREKYFCFEKVLIL